MQFDLMSVLLLAGGLGLFIYGMKVMGNGLECAAGPSLEKTLEKMTGNVFTALLMGMVVTAVIHSSAGTTVMVVGFVNAGIMTLQQSVGVILGANIGTTVTAQILRLSGADDGNWFLTLMDPKNLAYVGVVAGIIIMMRGKKNRTRYIADIFTGFGILFIGMSTMESALAPLAEMPQLGGMFAAISNPFLGLLVGALITALLQSSTASVGILQALSTTGVITWSAAVPIILGQNIGTCFTTFLSSLSGNKNARRAAMIHFYFNMIGSLVFLLVIYAIEYTIGFGFWETPIDKGGIANFHTFFNVAATLLFLPFSRVLVFFAEKTIPMSETAADPLARLEPRFLATPSIALEQAQKCIGDMGAAAHTNFMLATQPLFHPDAQIDAESFHVREAFLDRAEVDIAKYLVSINSDLPGAMRRMHAEMLHSLSDFEKIGDYAQNILECAEQMRDSEMRFSDSATRELKLMCESVSETIDLTVRGYMERSAELARAVEPVEEIVDTLKDRLKNRHIERLNAGSCTIQTGIPFLEIIHDLEKIGDHCSNIAIYTIQLCEGAKTFDTHSYYRQEYKESEAFHTALHMASEKYLPRLDAIPVT